MTFHERKHMASIIGSVIVFFSYAIYVYNDFHSLGSEAAYDLKFWARSILILVPVSIVGKILLAIGFYIFNEVTTNESEPKVVDERDKIIEMRSSFYSHWIFIAGFFFAMFSIMLDFTPSWMFIIMMVAGFLADITGEVLRIYYYRRGY